MILPWEYVYVKFFVIIVICLYFWALNKDQIKVAEERLLVLKKTQEEKAKEQRDELTETADKAIEKETRLKKEEDKKNPFKHGKWGVTV